MKKCEILSFKGKKVSDISGLDYPLVQEICVSKTEDGFYEYRYHIGQFECGRWNAYAHSGAIIANKYDKEAKEAVKNFLGINNDTVNWISVIF